MRQRTGSNLDDELHESVKLTLKAQSMLICSILFVTQEINRVTCVYKEIDNIS